MSVQLLEDFKIKPKSIWQVLPAEIGNEILWLDPAGFPLAKSKEPENWTYSARPLIDFLLDPDKWRIVAKNYV